MPTPRPAVDTSFIDDILLTMGDGVPPPLVLKRLERRVEQVLQTDRPHFVWMGRVLHAAAAWDVTRAHAVAAAARAAVGMDAQVLGNVSLAFQKLNEMDAALEYAQLAVQASPAFPFAVQSRIAALLLTGRWSDAVRATTEYVGLVGRENADPTLIDETPSRLAGLAAAGTSEEQAQLELAQCWAVLRERRIRHQGMSTYNEQDPETSSELFVIRVQVAGDIELEIELEAELALRLASLAGWDPTRLSVGYSYVEEEHADTAV